MSSPEEVRQQRILMHLKALSETRNDLVLSYVARHFTAFIDVMTTEYSLLDEHKTSMLEAKAGFLEKLKTFSDRKDTDFLDSMKGILNLTLPGAEADPTPKKKVIRKSPVRRRDVSKEPRGPSEEAVSEVSALTSAIAPLSLGNLKAHEMNANSDPNGAFFKTTHTHEVSPSVGTPFTFSDYKEYM
jgi:hypothetical protein